MSGSGGARMARGAAATLTTTALVLGFLGLAAPPAAAAPPVANPDTLALVWGTSAVIDPVANDTDPDPGAILALDPSSLLVTAGAGTVTPAGGNQVTIAAAPGYVGALTATYVVRDQNGELASGTITATVTAPNQLPIANPDATTVVVGTQVRIDPRANDADPDGEPLTVTAAWPASAGGTVTLDAGTLLITGTAVGTFVAAYQVADPRGGTANGTVTVTVTAPVPVANRAPVAGEDTASVVAGKTIRVPVLANDTDPDGEAIRLVKVRKPGKGSAKRVGQELQFKAPKSAGTVRVRYTVKDARGARTYGWLTVTVTRKTKPAPAPDPGAGAGSPSRAEVEAALARLGLPGGRADGKYDQLTRRAACAWRTITGRTASRKLPTNAEATAIVATGDLPAASPSMVTGVNVSITCQAAFWVSAAGNYRRVMAATTGIQRKYPTRRGIHRIFITHHVWRWSTIYPEARMYKPMQFSGGQALHGSATDRLVKWHPASHGCVRMLHRDIDALQSGGVGNGTLVRVFGRWAG